MQRVLSIDIPICTVVSVRLCVQGRVWFQACKLEDLQMRGISYLYYTELIESTRNDYVTK